MHPREFFWIPTKDPLFDFPPVSLNWLSVQLFGIRTLRQLVLYYLTLNLTGTSNYSPSSTPGTGTTDFAMAPSPTGFDYDISAALPSDPTVASVAATGDLWDTLDTYIQLAGARLWCDENGVWHLEDASIGQAPPPPTSLYGQDFESSADSWTASAVGASGLTSAISTNQFHTGTHGLRVNATSNPSFSPILAKRTITGLVVGQTYTLSAWAFGPDTTVPSNSIGVTGIGMSPVVVQYANWAQYSYQFTATATSHEMVLKSSRSTSGITMYWDDVALIGQKIDLTLSGSTTKGFSDTISRDADWYSAVAIQYSWTIASGVSLSSTDKAAGVGTVPQRWLYVTKDNTAYPGPGAAQALLNRVSQYGHAVDQRPLSTTSPRSQGRCSASPQWRAPTQALRPPSRGT